MIGLSGCSVNELATADRYAEGLVVVLPGIEGRSIYNLHIARGLADGHVESAIEIYDWGVGTPGSFLLNLTSWERNKRQARKLARRIRLYLNAFPGRPVHLIGHSGGAAIALLALESLGNECRATAAYLLGAAVSPDLDLSAALEHTELGIWNFYSPKDVSFLLVGTSVFGTMDRSHTRAAGAVGFRRPKHLDEASKTLYDTKLHEVPHDRAMTKVGCDGSHFGWASQQFARERLAPMILADVKAVRAPHYQAFPVASGILLQPSCTQP
jgi:pimeloyl-ACP methyl ester carboxylesterase